jgi:hypothetical protein
LDKAVPTIPGIAAILVRAPLSSLAGPKEKKAAMHIVELGECWEMARAMKAVPKIAPLE